MLQFALVFFIFSLIAAIFGFSGLAAASAGVAQILFYLFIGLFFLSLLVSVMQESKDVFDSPNKP